MDGAKINGRKQPSKNETQESRWKMAKVLNQSHQKVAQNQRT